MTENRQPAEGSSAVALGIPLGAIAVAAAAASGFWTRTAEQRQALAFAVAVTIVGQIAAWVTTRAAPTSPAGRVAATLMGVGLRLFPALAALAWLQAAGDSLKKHGAAGYLAVLYLTALAAEVIRTIMAGRGGPRRRGDTRTI